MPKLPNADQAFIEPAKLMLYLLDPAHEDGGPKAQLLAAIGFDLGDAATVEAALLGHGRAHEATVRQTEYGVRYEVNGPLETPTGRTALIRTVWQIDTGSTAPRLITVKPLKVSKS